MRKTSDQIIIIIIIVYVVVKNEMRSYGNSRLSVKD